MREFDEQLLRLKQAVRLSEDQDVADLLGMTKAAFSARKVRGAFPADKVKALALDRPDLKIDVKYVLSGVSDELERRLSALSKSTAVANRIAEERAVYEVQKSVFDLLVNELSAQEQLLIGRFRSADDLGREAILATAAAITERLPNKKNSRGKTQK